MLGACADNFPSLSLSLRVKQSRPQSPRYPCPAERENEDLCNKVFQLEISMAKNTVRAVVPFSRSTASSRNDSSQPCAMDVQTRSAGQG